MDRVIIMNEEEWFQDLYQIPTSTPTMPLLFDLIITSIQTLKLFALGLIVSAMAAAILLLIYIILCILLATTLKCHPEFLDQVVDFILVIWRIYDVLKIIGENAVVVVAMVCLIRLFYPVRILQTSLVLVCVWEVFVGVRLLVRWRRQSRIEAEERRKKERQPRGRRKGRR